MRTIRPEPGGPPNELWIRIFKPDGSSVRLVYDIGPAARKNAQDAGFGNDVKGFALDKIEEMLRSERLHSHPDFKAGMERIRQSGETPKGGERGDRG